MSSYGNPPPLAAVPVQSSPTPYNPSFLANTYDRAIGNSTFVLKTTGTTDPDDSVVMPLHQIPGVKRAIIAIEAAEGAAKGAVLARIWMDGTYPSQSEGLPLKDGGVIEIVGTYNVLNTRIISADDKAHTIHIQYFN